MKYKVNFTSREWEIIGEGFNFDDYYAGKYDDTERLYFSREAWQGDIPIFLSDTYAFSPDEILVRANGIVTPQSVFSIFGKENLTFAEMLQEIWTRRKEIVKVVPGDNNPYE
ncbi:MAG: hypothetical protein ABIL70_04205 [candidate division WOR-3 bacterium]